MPCGAEAVADVRGAPILPANRLVDRRTGRTLPHKRRFALIGDADTGDGARPADFTHRALADIHGGAPNFFAIMLDPAGRGIVLRQFRLRERARREGFIEHQGACRCGALIDGEDVARHAPQ